MNIHEYQAKALLREMGAPVARGIAAFTVAEAEKAARELPGPVWVVKAQIHAGGRGKGRFKESEAGDKGGVRIAKSVDEVVAHARQMLGHTLVTRQSGAAGRVVRRLYVEDGSAIARELYLSCLVDRADGRTAFIASAEGGMDIEEVAAHSPEKIITVHVDPAAGYSPHIGGTIAYALGLRGDAVKQCVALVGVLHAAFRAKDMSVLEINPLVLTKDGQLLCLDAKVNFDDNALFRHPDVAALRDPEEEDPKEVEAAKSELSYIALNGTIGCMVNGAGLAMATMDIIKLYGAEPANFLDVGGGASKEKVTAAFKIITADPKVKGILVNIFGGIMRCDVVAEGIVAAVKEVGLKVPLVVRLEGTNVELGRAIIARSGLNVINADDLDDAAAKAVAATKGEGVTAVAGPAVVAPAATPAARACPLCAGRTAEPLAQYSTPDWHVVRCASCSFVYLSNPPAYKELETDFAWERTSVVESARRKRERPFLMWLDQVTRWRLHMLKPSRQDFYRGLFRRGRVLDVGCANGGGPPEPFIPYGIEISRGLYEQARLQMAARGGEAVHGAAAEAIQTFPDRFFTGVIMSSVVEHETQPKVLLAHVARVLEQDGKAYIRVPNFGSVNRAVNGGKWCGFRHPDHVNYFTVATLRRMAAECGLKVRLLNPIRLPLDDNINAVLTKV